MDFGKASFREADIRGKSVLEVGSLDVNGSLRPVIAPFGPASYLGVDLQSGRGVDRICRVEDLVATFGPEAFDVVICTELLEHVKDWRAAISNLKQVMKRGGRLLITTRSKGFEYHGYPFDFWRYEPSDMRAIFADLEIESLGGDPGGEPGVFLAARKPHAFVEKTPGGYKLYSIVLNARSSVLRNNLCWTFAFLPLCKLIGKRRWINMLKKR